MSEKRSPALGVSKHIDLTDKEVAGVIDHADGSVTSPKLAFDTFTVVSDQTLGSDAMSITFSGLDMEGEGPYMLLCFIKAGIAGGFDVMLFFNGDEEQTHYYNQAFWANFTSIGAARANTAGLFTTTDGAEQDMVGQVTSMKIAGQYPRSLAFSQRFSAPISISIMEKHHVRTNAENVTSLTLKSSAADSLGAGSRFVLLRVT